MIKLFGKHALNIKAHKPIDKKYHKLNVPKSTSFPGCCVGHAYFYDNYGDRSQ